MKGRDGNTSARPGVFPPCFYPTSPRLPPPPPPPPTYSPSSLNLWDDEIGVQELGERHGRRQLTGTILWV